MTKYKYTCRIDGVIEIDDENISEHDRDPFHKNEFDITTVLNRLCNKLAFEYGYWTTTGFGVSKVQRINTDGSIEDLSTMTGGCGGC